MKNLVLVALITVVSIAQPLTAGWVKTYGGVAPDFGCCISKTSEQFYVVSGTTSSFPHPADYNTWLLKFDTLGDTSWARVLIDEGYNDFGFCVRKVPNDGYIVASNKGLIKTNENGETAWIKPYSSEFVDVTSECGYVLIGDTGFIKLDSSGSVVVSQRYDEYYSSFQCANSTSDSGYIICGWSVLVKVDKLGNVLWVDEDFIPMANYVRYIAEGYKGYVYLGDTWGGGSDTIPNMDMRAAEWVRGEGDAWSITDGGPVDNEYGNFIMKTSDQGYIIAGNPWTILKLTDDGDVVWCREYGYEGRYILETSDGGYIATGSSYDGDLLLVKTDSQGLLGINEPPLVTLPVTHLDIASPIGSEITLRYSNCPNGFRASVYDATGRKIDMIESSGESGTLSWGSGHGPGVYFIVPQVEKASPSKVVLVK